MGEREELPMPNPLLPITHYPLPITHYLLTIFNFNEASSRIW